MLGSIDVNKNEPCWELCAQETWSIECIRGLALGSATLTGALPRRS